MKVKKNSVLILTQYYPPETGAPQNRLHSLAKNFIDMDVEVHILTAMPNYPLMAVYPKYLGKFFTIETFDKLKIFRSWIFVSKNKSIVFRLINYFSFVFSSIFISGKLKKSYDYVLCESPPLFLGLSAIFISSLKGAKLVFNVSDLWPESAEKLNLVRNKKLLNLATKLEEYIYAKSDKISGQTLGIINNIKIRFPEKKYFWLKNGFDFSDIKKSELKSDLKWLKKGSGDFFIYYAGIHGYAQGLETILETALLLKKNGNIKFFFIGEGPEKEKLMNIKLELSLDNVNFINNLSKKDLLSKIKIFDACIVPLKKMDLFKGAIPSKIFENLALGIPVLLGVDGEAKELFTNEGKCALYFEPENSKDLSQAIELVFYDNNLRQELINNGLEYVNEGFNREKIARDFHKFLFNE